jgi:RNA 3'-terminal phosphate cyclase (ATP)
MLDIDGGQHTGSGTIVRYAVALAALLGQPLHLFNARAKRPTPGLRSQHVASVLACAELCGAKTDGVKVGSREFSFAPGVRIKGGDFAWDIGTAGSTTMLALSMLPLACFADRPVTARITGGVFQDFAPSPHHMQHVLLPLLRRMGVAVELQVIRPGYVPRGAGTIELRARPVKHTLNALTLTEQGLVGEVSGIAFSSHLAERRVSERMARICEQYLVHAGLSPTIQRMDDTTAPHAGASLAVWAETSTLCLVGADRAGAVRRSSEAIGRFVAEMLLADLSTGATVDRHLADQLVLFAALADGTSHYRVPFQTAHLDSNLWIVSVFGVQTSFRESQVTIQGLGFHRQHGSPY